jgi:hypothetical protein
VEIFTEARPQYLVGLLFVIALGHQNQAVPGR